MRGARGAAWSLCVGGLLVVACGGSPTEDPVAPACSGVSPANLATEQTPAGQCPSHPTILIGTGVEGDACSEPTDCAPVCCSCPGEGTGALVAECNNGNCLDGATECCLYAQQCAQ
jgi:hypothetical protein